MVATFSTTSFVSSSKSKSKERGFYLPMGDMSWHSSIGAITAAKTSPKGFFSNAYVNAPDCSEAGKHQEERHHKDP